MEEYLITSIFASIEAGKAILEVYQSDFSVEHKSDNSPLTLADKRSHEIITRYLNRFNIPVLSEEGAEIPYGVRKNWDRLFVVDPLDGTKEFIKRNDEFTVNIALVTKNKPIIGVIYTPVLNELFFSSENIGSYKLEMNNIPNEFVEQIHKKERGISLDHIIEKSAKLPIIFNQKSDLVIMGSRSHSTPELQAFVDQKRHDYDHVEFISAGSSLKLCAVAEGRADIYPRLGPTMEWDTAAGQAIVECSGGTVLRHNNDEPLFYNKENLLNPWFVARRA